jgi:CRISP-associated protein Cas1
MISKIIEISNAGTYLSVKLGQLVVRRKDEDSRQIPCEDVGVLLVDHSGVTYTHSVFTTLLKHGAAVVICNGNHHPAGMFLPIESNSLQSERFRDQIQAKEPVKKRLWQQIIRAKITHQAAVIEQDSQTARKLLNLRSRVRSGDTSNIESQASRLYWQAYMGDVDFRRKREGAPPNNLLNYGYMVMRAAVARAICSAGLLPTLGIHHRNRYNAYCLADDMIEPFRGFVDKKVLSMVNGVDAEQDLDQHSKAAILELLYEPVKIAGFSGPLMVGLHRTMASLQRCFAGQQNKLDLPQI